MGKLERNDAFARTIKDITGEIPSHEGQVGLVVIDEKGVYDLELFDSHESWSALKDGMVNKFAEVLVRKIHESVIDVKVNEGNVKDVIKLFLLIMKSPETTISSKTSQNSIIIKVRRPIHGEAAFLDGEFVHLTAIRAGDEANEVRGGNMRVPIR